MSMAARVWQFCARRRESPITLWDARGNRIELRDTDSSKLTGFGASLESWNSRKHTCVQLREDVSGDQNDVGNRAEIVQDRDAQRVL